MKNVTVLFVKAQIKLKHNYFDVNRIFYDETLLKYFCNCSCTSITDG